jgi:long-chain acyl-CoA synthetase
MESNELGARPGRVAARLAKLVERAVTEADLSLPQYRLLAFLSEASVAASALADKLAVSPPSVTALVDGLVARGLVERRPDAADRRRVTHVLTEDGHTTLAGADAEVAAALGRLVDLLPAARRRRAIEGLELWGEALDAARTRTRTRTHTRSLTS